MSSPIGNGPNREAVTIREIYTLIQSVRAEIMAEFAKVTTEVDTRFDKHNERHDRERASRLHLTLWAVTTLLAAVGIGITLYLGISDKI